MQAYCLKCRQKQEIQNSSDVVMKNGVTSTRGGCAGCGLPIVAIRGRVVT